MRKSHPKEAGRVPALPSFGGSFLFMRIHSLSQNYQIWRGNACGAGMCVLESAIPRQRSCSSAMVTTFTYKPRDRTDYNTLRRSLACSVTTSSSNEVAAACHASWVLRWRPGKPIRRPWWRVLVTYVALNRPLPWSSGHAHGEAVVPPLSWM